MATFSYLLNYPAKLTREPALLSVQFGDGYRQDAGDGINTNLETWNLQASNLPEFVGIAIDAFLLDKGGYTSFTWTAPQTGATAKDYICKKWNISYNDEDEANFSAVFEEVADL